MITNVVKTYSYVCEKCDKVYSNDKDCEKHENECAYSKVAEIIHHDGKHTKQSKFLDEFRFYRMCSVSESWSKNHHCWLGVNRQYTIAKDKSERPRIYCNNNWSTKDERSKACYNRQSRITNITYFDYDSTDKERENVIRFKPEELQKCSLLVTYKNGKTVYFGSETPILERDNEIALYSDNPIIRVDLFDIEPKPEILIRKTAGYTCLTPCPYRPTIRIGSNACKECPNFADNRGDYSLKPEVACNYKTNKANEEARFARQTL